jgi:hypothetical protein
LPHGASRRRVPVNSRRYENGERLQQPESRNALALKPWVCEGDVHGKRGLRQFTMVAAAPSNAGVREAGLSTFAGLALMSARVDGQ